MKNWNKIPKLDLNAQYNCGICKEKFIGANYIHHKFKCAPKLNHVRYAWVIKKVREPKPKMAISTINKKIKDGYIKCSSCAASVFKSNFEEHINSIHPNNVNPNTTELKFFKSEIANTNKKVRFKRKYANSRFSFASNYTIDDEKTINIAIGRAAFFPKKP